MEPKTHLKIGIVLGLICFILIPFYEITENIIFSIFGLITGVASLNSLIIYGKEK